MKKSQPRNSKTTSGRMQATGENGEQKIAEQMAAIVALPILRN